MGKQRQKRKAPKKRLNPIQRRVQQGVAEGQKQIPAPTPEQVAPVIERVILTSLNFLFSFMHLVIPNSY